MPCIRHTLENNESATLAAYALLSRDSRGRAHAEPPAQARTAFQRDRDRITHAAAFRRLQYKTQVFLNDAGDYFRTRLTHTLEVAQIGRALARALRINEDLVEAICLAHDLGHPPFGHTGEAALDDLLRDCGGFNHNVQSYRVVTTLERRYSGWRGLNLTLETLDGIAKHDLNLDYRIYGEVALDAGPSLEAQIANIADDLAYNAHDLDDGLQAGLLSPEQCAELDLWRNMAERTGWRGGDLDELSRHHLIRELVGALVDDVLQETLAQLDKLCPRSARDLQNLPSAIVGHSPDFQEQNRQLKDFLNANLYRHERILCMQAAAQQVIEELYDAFRRDPRLLPDDMRRRLDNEAPERVIADAIAGLTDRSAWQLHQRLMRKTVTK